MAAYYYHNLTTGVWNMSDMEDVALSMCNGDNTLCYTEAGNAILVHFSNEMREQLLKTILEINNEY
jgi:hypothetical protein